MITNLLEETKEVLGQHNLSLEDVNWVGCKDFTIPITHFIKIANVQYDNGYGGAEVATDLLIVGKDWWLERHEYDGSEWWEFKQMPKKPSGHYMPTTITAGMWSTIKEMSEQMRDGDNG